MYKQKTNKIKRKMPKQNKIKQKNFYKNVTELMFR